MSETSPVKYEQAIPNVLRAMGSVHEAMDGHGFDRNGLRGVVLQQAGKTIASVSVAYDEIGKATNIYVMRNPDKLSSLIGSANA